MLSLRARRPRRVDRLRRHVVLLLVAAWPALAMAQNATSNDPAASSASAPAAIIPAAAAAPAAPAPPPPPPVLPAGLFIEPQFITGGVDFVARFSGGSNGGPGSNGFYPEFSNMNTGSGFVSVGPGYRHDVFGGKGFFDTSAAVSWHFYRMAQARLEFPNAVDARLSGGVQVMYEDNTQISYFGIGPQASSAEQTQYRLQATETVGYATVRPNSWLSVNGELGWIASPTVSTPAGTFNPDFPYAGVVYPNDPAMNLPDQPSFLRTELSVLSDTLNAHGHPTAGSQYWGAMTHYADQSGPGGFSFTQFEAEGIQMVPIVGRRLLLGLHAWTVHSVVGENNEIPFYLLPAIGGSNTIRSFDSFQFHDLNSITTTAELRLALWMHLDLVGFVDAGNVAARYWDLNLDQTAVGAGLRLHTARATIGRLDMAHGSNGWSILFRTGDPFKLSRVTRRLGTVPFAP